jgi:hypothetical protein
MPAWREASRFANAPKAISASISLMAAWYYFSSTCWLFESPECGSSAPRIGSCPASVEPDPKLEPVSAARWFLGISNVGKPRRICSCLPLLSLTRGNFGWALYWVDLNCKTHNKVPLSCPKAVHVGHVTMVVSVGLDLPPLLLVKMWTPRIWTMAEWIRLSLDRTHHSSLGAMGRLPA